MTLARLLCLISAWTLAACTSELDQATRDTPIGDFRLDRLVVIVDDPIESIVSRTVSEDVLKAAVTDAVDRRLRRFDGRGSYSIGIKVQGYVLSPRAVPVLFAPRSQLFLSINAYDDVPKRLNPETRNLIVNESSGGDTVVGSGYFQSAEEQLAELAENAAIEIERWLRENEDWFGGSAARPVPDLPDANASGETAGSGA